MRTLRVVLAGTVITVALLAGPAYGVMGQSEEGPWPKLEPPIEYGTDDSRQVIHAYRPEPREAPRPAVIILHGGGLFFGEPLQDADIARHLADLGYVAFMAGYRLVDAELGENPWPTQLDDAQRAVRWVRAHADEFNVDPDRICSTGHSSGGHLASLLGTMDTRDDSDPALAGFSSRVDCVATVSGDVDLTVPNPDPIQTEVYEFMLGATVDEDPEAWQAASPAYLVDEDTVPFLVIHGNRDEAVSVQAARNLADALAAADREFVYAEVPAGHLDVGVPEATMALADTFMAYQLHPEN